jgi:uncharacterized DUF497 family protein
MAFEWHETKRLKNIDDHEIDFIRAKEIWHNPVLELKSPQNHHGEERFLAIGQIEIGVITVVYTWRGDNRRLISARKARKNEKENYENAVR